MASQLVCTLCLFNFEKRIHSFKLKISAIQSYFRSQCLRVCMSACLRECESVCVRACAHTRARESGGRGRAESAQFQGRPDVKMAGGAWFLEGRKLEG